MRVLFITQKVDAKDTVLSFVGGWIKVFAERFEKVSVVCLEQGEVSVPYGVSVFSLGKESGQSRIKYIYRFLRYIVRERNEYDVVFVHMNPEYEILGGLIWKLFGKRTALWYNHSQGGIKLSLAVRLADKIFHTSPYSASAKFTKSVQMPVGVDTDVFKYLGTGHNRKGTRRILSLGRVAPIKGIHVILEAVAELARTGHDISLTIVGDSLPRDREYKNSLIARTERPDLSGRVEFVSGESDRLKVAEIMSRHEFFVNASPAGLFDKTVFESASCRLLPVVSSKAFVGLLPPECIFEEENSMSLVKVLDELMKKDNAWLDKAEIMLADKVAKEHGLRKLVAMVKDNFYFNHNG
jgi:glycosyltransferase involved in cell wall biosynthesis